MEAVPKANCSSEIFATTDSAERGCSFNSELRLVALWRKIHIKVLVQSTALPLVLLLLLSQEAAPEPGA